MMLDGYTLWARKTLYSAIFKDKPDKWFKIFFFLVMKANFKDNDKWKRGEALTSYTEIAEFTGANRNEIDHCLRWLKGSDTFGRMLATRKATRGFHFAIVKYEQYQDSATYKATPKAIEKRHRSDTIKNKGNKGNISAKVKTSLVVIATRTRKIRPTSKKPLTLQETVVEKLKPFSIPTNLEIMANKQRHIQVIGLYWHYLDTRFENYEQYQTQLTRNVRAAKRLTGYSDDQILKTMRYYDKQSENGEKFNWSLETLLKKIQDLIK